MPKTTPYKRKGRKLEFSSHGVETSNEESLKHHTEKQKDSSESSDDNKKKKKYKPYEDFLGEFKKIKPPVFNGEIEKIEEEEAWLSGMKKYFQIYIYFDELKAKMAIYNKIGKAYIWWQDIKKVKGIKERYVTWKTF